MQKHTNVSSKRNDAWIAYGCFSYSAQVPFVMRECHLEWNGATVNDISICAFLTVTALNGFALERRLMSGGSNELNNYRY